MEIIRGKHASFIDALALAERVAKYESVQMDIGTGDGKFVKHLAQTHPNHLMIGIDACRENLHDVSRGAPANALFVIANAQSLPPELHRLADKITINFPWGSLLEGLLINQPTLIASLIAVAALHAEFEVRLNGGALAEAGWSLEQGAERVCSVLLANGFNLLSMHWLSARDLKAYPTTWAKRLAFGRDPRAIYLRGCYEAREVARL